MVSAYEKYCTDCVKKYGLAQDKDWHRSAHSFTEAELKAEVRKDKNAGATRKAGFIKPLTFRVECSGGCGALVLRKIGECRKCKKKRLHAGLKRIKKLEKVAA